MTGKFSLNWHTYIDHLQLMLKDLYEDVKFSDITLISDDQTQFKAHKIVVDMNNIVKILPQCEGVVGVRYSTLL